MKKYLLLTAVVLLLSSMLQGGASGADETAKAYAVYSAVIANMFAGEQITFDSGAKVKRLVIQNVTATDSTAVDKLTTDGSTLKRCFPTLTAGVAKDFRARNKQPVV